MKIIRIIALILFFLIVVIVTFLLTINKATRDLNKQGYGLSTGTTGDSTNVFLDILTLWQVYPLKTPSTPTTQKPTTTTPVDPTADLPATDSSTEGWKTYENKDYGFSFKYPEGWILTDNYEGIVQLYNTSGQREGTELSESETKIVVYQYNDVLENAINKNTNNVTIISRGAFNVAGKNGEKIIAKPELGSETTFVFFPNVDDSKTFEFVNMEDNNQLDQILSTFKFTK